MYIPKKGDIVYVNFNPQSGREQAGLRPALVMTSIKYNGIVGLALFCPITSQQKGYPFEVQLPKNLKTKGVILSDHVRSIDWNARHVRYVENVGETCVAEVLGRLGILLET